MLIPIQHATLAFLFFLPVLAVPAPAVPLPPSKGPSITSKDWIEAVCKTSHHSKLVPWDKPVISWPKHSKTSPQKYLKPFAKPFGKDVAEWQHRFFGTGAVNFRDKPEVLPVREGAPTMISIFYPDPKQVRRPIDTYLARIKRLADTGEQMMIYVPHNIADKIKAMRKDKTHWIVVDLDGEFPSVMDYPNVKEQISYIEKQGALFKALTGQTEQWKPKAAYNNDFLTAVYHAKWYAVYDAVMRNPFGSTTWMYIDAGLYEEQGPKDKEGVLWGSVLKSKPFLNSEKFQRALNLSGDSGVTVPEYPQNPIYGKNDFTNDCWTDPTRLWRCHHFPGGAWIGSSLGMLEFSVKYMQTVDDMNANGLYTGREEFNMPFVAARYPNTLFSIPWDKPPEELKCSNWFPIKAEFSSWGGPKYVSAINDPIDTLFCPSSTGYKPRRPNLPRGQVPK